MSLLSYLRCSLYRSDCTASYHIDIHTTFCSFCFERYLLSAPLNRRLERRVRFWPLSSSIETVLRKGNTGWNEYQVKFYLDLSKPARPQREGETELRNSNMCERAFKIIPDFERKGKDEKKECRDTAPQLEKGRGKAMKMTCSDGYCFLLSSSSVSTLAS